MQSQSLHPFKNLLSCLLYFKMLPIPYHLCIHTITHETGREGMNSDH